MKTPKDMIKGIFPNTIDIINLEIQKKKDRKSVQKIQLLKETEYPALLEKIYKQKTGNELDLKNPRRLTEKIQWRKLYEQNPLYSKLSDKYLVRKWVEDRIGADYLVPLIGAWGKFDQIDFKQMPDQFVLKTNNASHTNIIVTDKKQFMRKRWSAKRRMEYWLKAPFAFQEGLELHYQKITPMIIAEEYLPPVNGKSSLTDYKFFCFHNTPYLCQVISDRSSGETIDFFDTKWEHMAIRRPPYPNADNPIEKPEIYDQMIAIAAELCKGFEFVRVDLYEHAGKVYFGEMTFTPASGMMKFEPDDWDYKLGDLWIMQNK
ncbi:MAG: glycosyltransferase [Clostridiales bacterium]|nr:glycosyltransferase [Clostridiales bacterium]